MIGEAHVDTGHVDRQAAVVDEVAEGLREGPRVGRDVGIGRAKICHRIHSETGFLISGQPGWRSRAHIMHYLFAARPNHQIADVLMDLATVRRLIGRPSCQAMMGIIVRGLS